MMPHGLDLVVVGAILGAAIATLVRHFAKNPGGGICAFGEGCDRCASAHCPIAKVRDKRDRGDPVHLS